MIYSMCEKCSNIRYDESPRCSLGYWEGIELPLREYDHTWDNCKDFSPDFNSFEGLLHIISNVPDTWVPSILIYIVRHGFRHKIFSGYDDAKKIIDKTSKDYLIVEDILKKTEESISFQKYQRETGKLLKLKRRKNKKQPVLRRRKK